jgi:hypothetical protein
MTDDFGLIFGGRVYQVRKVCRAKDLWRCNLWPWPCDLETEIPFRSVSPKQMKIFSWYLVRGCIRGQRCVAWKIRADVTQNCIIIPFRSVSPKRMKIFGWYLVGGCILGQRCVTRKIRVDVTFDLEPVTLKQKFPSALYLLNKWRFSVDIWWEDVSGDKGVLRKRFVPMWPLTLTQNCIILPLINLLNKWRFFVDIWWEDVTGGQKFVMRKICVDVTFDLDPVTLKPKFPSLLLIEWTFLVDIWRNYVTCSDFVSQLHSNTSTCQFLELYQAAGMLSCVHAQTRSI